MMTGSGSVVYGVFETEQTANIACEKLRPLAQQYRWGDVWMTHTLGE